MQRCIAILLILSCAGTSWSYGADSSGKGEKGVAAVKQKIALKYMKDIEPNQWYVAMGMKPVETDVAAETAFTKSLNVVTGNILYAKLPMITGAEQVGLVMKENMPEGLYIDLNMNGKLEKNEELKPDRNVFLTPIITVKEKEGTEKNVRLRIMAFGDRVYVSSASVWKGEGTLNGKPVTLIIGDANQSGTPDVDGSDMVQIVGTEETERMARPQLLSKIIKYNGAFYEVSISKDGIEFEIAPATMATGTINIIVPSKKKVNGTLMSGTAQGAKEKGINYSLNNEPITGLTLPKGEYRIPYLYMRLVPKEGEEWNVLATTTQEIPIAAGKATDIALSTPKVVITAVVESKKQETPDAQISECSEGEILFFNVKLLGDNGIVYTRIMRVKDPGPTYPVLKILDEKGKELVTKTMEYG